MSPVARSTRRRPAVLDIVQARADFEVPSHACDSHVHVFGSPLAFPFAEDRAYLPAQASIESLRMLHGQLGIERVVIVQPSPYGTDNGCLVDALQRIGPGARGVVDLDPAVDDAGLAQMHAAGVRGVRINLEVKGLNDPAYARERVRAVARRVEPLGWHLQFFTNLRVLAALREEIARLSLPVVVDHFALARASDGIGQPGLADLLALVRAGKVWVKLSAPQRISDDPDGPAVTALAQALIQANPERMLWGSDWPHPGPWPGVQRRADVIEPFHPVDDGHALNRLARWANDPRLVRRILVDNPAALYGF